MYLSQLLIDRTNRKVMRVLADVYRLHQLVMSGFCAYNQLARVLFRVEPEVRGNFVQVLVQSHQKPCWDRTAGDRASEWV